MTFALWSVLVGALLVLMALSGTVLKRLPGVTKADVSYEKGTAVVKYDPAKVTVAQMVAAIKTLGYTATKVAG